MTAPTPADPNLHPASAMRWLLRALISLLLALLASSLLLAYVCLTDSGSQNAWRLAVWAMHGKLAGEYAGGNLAQGIRLRHLHYRDDTRQLDIDHIEGSWRLAARQRQFTVAYLRAGHIDVKLLPTPSSPMTLPASMRLPLALELRELSWQQLHLRQGSSNITLGALQLHGSSDGLHHLLVVEQLNTDFGIASARLRLEGQTPYVASGNITLNNQDLTKPNTNRPEQYQLTTQFQGSLQELGIAVTASGDHLSGKADLIVMPFAAMPLKQASIDVQHINPQAFLSAAPVADLHLRADLQPVAPATGSALQVTGSVSLLNAIAGRLEQQRLPLQSLHGTLKLSMAQQEISDLRIVLLNNGSLSGGGVFKPASAAGLFNLQINDLDLHALHQQLQPTRLQGPLTLTVKPEQLDVALQLQDPRYAIAVDGSIGTDLVAIRQARLTTAGASLNLSGELHTDASMGYAIKGELSNFDPSLWLRQQAVAARINMHFDASGAISPQLHSKLTLRIDNSSYNQLPLTGSGTVELIGTRLLPSRLDLLIAGNRLQLNGAFGAATDRLDLHLDAPQLARLGYGLGGALKLSGQLSGGLQQPALRASYSGTQLAWGAHRLASLRGQADLQIDLANQLSSANNKLMLVLNGTNYHGPDADLQQLNMALTGTYGAHQLQLQADGRIRGQTLALQMGAHGKLTQSQHGYAWKGVIDKLDNQGKPHLWLAAPLSLALGPQMLVAGATQIKIDRMNIDLRSFSYLQGRLHSQGSAQSIDVGQLLTLAAALSGSAAPVKSDLVMAANWDFSLAESASGFLSLQRQSGDMWLERVREDNSTPILLGMSNLQLRIDLADQQARLQGNIAASRIGNLDLQGWLDLPRQGGLLTLDSSAPMALTARLNVAQLNSIGALLGPQYGLEGKLAIQLKVDGSLGTPQLSGTLDGDNLAITLFDQGILLKDGIARLVMSNNVVDLRTLQFHGSSGTLNGSGKLRMGGTDPQLQASIVADQLQLFASPDRQLMLSGQAQLANINDQLHIDGKFVVDKALFDLPTTSAPKLGNDVVILSKTNTAAGTSGTEPADSLAPVINILINLGDKFRFKGNGANLRLHGEMTVHSSPSQALSATGTINVAEGTYEAFGARLNIERGIINFQGPINNPNLNILAMRRNQDVAAGVEVTGTANQPRIRLVSEPNVADDEKLSWMMFGHSSDSSGIGQRSASSQALALIGNYGGKKIARDLGFDQFSIGASESGLTDGQVVNIGKAISDRLSVGYEQSLSGGASVAKVTWQLSKRWSAVVRTGTLNGLNFFYTLRFDGGKARKY